MSDGTVYDQWRRAAQPWAQWVKPALFDRLEETSAAEAEGARPSEAHAPAKSIDTSWLPEKAAVILDLPGEQALVAALALGERGMRPVFAINASSSPTGAEAISTAAVRRLLLGAGEQAASLPTGGTAPPAFILDSRRGGDELPPPPGSFDNRWVAFPSDLPGAEELRRGGLDRVVVVQEGAACMPDLAAILRVYQRAGLELMLRDVGGGALGPLKLPEMAWLREVAGGFYRRLRLTRRADGAYGRWVPLPPKPSHG